MEDGREGRLSRPPEGCRDIMPEEATWRRRAEEAMAGVMRRWGYREVVTPTLEFDSCVAVTGSVSGQTYRFVDRRGEVLTLRPDMTGPLARLAATKLALEGMPLRLFYAGSIFRYYDGNDSRNNETFQMGAELIGRAGPHGDAEVVCMALDCLAAVGFKDFRLVLGHAGFLEALLLDVGLLPDDRRGLLELLQARDLAGIRRRLTFLRESGRLLLAPDPAAALEALLTGSYAWAPPREGPVLPAGLCGLVGELSRRALGDLEAVVELVEVHAGLDKVTVDLGLVRDLDYYTGPVFEIYAPGTGLFIGGGGRYDDLLARFGVDRPATGFALNLDEMAALALREDRQAYLLDYVVIPAEGLMKEAWALGRELRRCGFSVCVEEGGGGPPAREVVRVTRRNAADLLAEIRARGEVTAKAPDSPPSPRPCRLQSIH